MGLKKGDQILEVNNTPIKYNDELISIVQAQRKDSLNPQADSISFKVLRGDQTLSFKEYFKGEKGVGYYAIAERPEGGLAQDRPLGVDVVGGGRAAGQRHLAEHERVLAQLGDQRLTGVPSSG